MQTNRAAFFDIDGTLARESMLIQHFKRLIKYGIIDESEWINRIRPRYHLYNQRYAEYDEYLDELAEVYKENLKGLPRTVIDFTAQQVVDHDGDVVYKFTRDAILNHQRSGDLVFFVSGSPDFLIEKMARKYHVDAWRATTYCTDSNGIFTGEIVPMWDSMSKSEVVRQFVEQYRLDMQACYAYGDTNGDFSMLKMLGHAVAINPSHRLLDMIQTDSELEARANIVIERKDVIYTLGHDTRARKSIH